MKFRLRLISFGLFLMMLAASAEAARVRVAIPSTTHAVLAFSTSRDKGYYRDEGLEVELILMSAPIASRALLSGDVEVATVGGAGLPPLLSGAPLRFVFTTYNRPMFWLFGKSEIRNVKELKGKKSRCERHRQRSRLSTARDAEEKRVGGRPRRGGPQFGSDADDLQRASERGG